MAQYDRARRINDIAREAMAILGTGRQVAPFSSRHDGFDLAEAYEVAAEVRELRRARGENVLGRKIGFTDRSVWSGYGISAPIWNYVFDSTVLDLSAAHGMFALSGFPEPRIEPEIVLHLVKSPHPDMGDAELIGCVDWVAHAFEVVHSIFPGWRFAAADAVAAYGVHTALVLGAKHSIFHDQVQWAKALCDFSVELRCDDGTMRSGHGHNVLGGPFQALRFLVEEVERYPAGTPLRSGELITTGTLTEAMPVKPGQTWSTQLTGIDLPGLRLRLC